MPVTFAGSIWKRAVTHWRVRGGRAPLPPEKAAPEMPDYDRLVPEWSHRARKEKEALAVHESQ
jgi:hypothetical protein